MIFTDNHMSEGRDSIEFLLMRLDDQFPEVRSMALCCMWAGIGGGIPDEVFWKIERREYPPLRPDFYDKDDRPRLLLSTIAKRLGIEQKFLVERHLWEFGNDAFRCAGDFINLTGEKYAESTGEMRKLYLKAWHDFTEEAPQQLKDELEKKFQEVFGDALSTMQHIGTDEDGNKVYSSAEVAKSLGITEDEAIQRMQEMQEVGATGFFFMPDPDESKPQ